jgi:EpsI family protein
VLKLSLYAPALILSTGYLLVSNARGQRAVELAAPIESVLPAVDGYRAESKKIPDEERRVAGMTSYVVRVFQRDSSTAFTTLVAYYDHQARGQSIHSPRNCLPGAGWEILSGGTETVSAKTGTYSVNRYILKHGATRAVVYYWYQGRGRVVASEYAVKWNLLKDAALSGHTEEALVRVVVPIKEVRVANAGQRDTGVDEANLLGKTVAGRLIGEVDRILPRTENRS